MKSEIMLAALFLLELLCLWWASTKQHRWLHGLVIINMVCISIFGEKLVSSFGFVSNVGNICYAFVCVAQINLCIIEKDQKNAILNILRALASLLMLLAFSQVIISLPVVSGNEEFSNAAVRVASAAPNIVVASFLAFVVSQTVLIKIFTVSSGSTFLKFVFATVVCQVLDSAIFFPIAFIGNMHSSIIGLAVVGCITKVVVMLLLFPLSYKISKLRTGKGTPYS